MCFIRCRFTCLLAASFFGCNSVYASESEEWLCQVEGTDDRFRVETSQRIYQGSQFQIFQLIDGLTVLVLNTETLRFNRLSSLNLLAQSSIDPNNPAEPIQLFNGECESLSVNRP